MFQGFYQAPPEFAAQQQAAAWLGAQYPQLQIFSLGESAAGRRIHAFGLGDLREAAVFVGGVHGMEWITTLLLYRLLEDLARCQQTGKPLAEWEIGGVLRHRSLVVIPCLNPDGVEIALYGAAAAGCYAPLVEKLVGQAAPCRWQANARGVDLNHNFDAGHGKLRQMEIAAGITGPAPTRYGGESPHSEPETQALAALCRALHPRQAYAFHAQGEEIYYRYGPHTPARSQLMGRVLASASGYRLADPVGLASHGGFKDWFIQELHRPAFTIEVGRGENPLPVEELGPLYARLLELLLLAVLL